MMETSVTNGMCRCCASEGAFKDVKSSYHWMGLEEVYGDMLRECFDISLSISEGEQGSICELCITQLRNAVNFKKQVLHTEEQFKTQIQNKLFKPSIVKVEMSPDDANESGEDNISGDEDYSGPEFEVPIKTEAPDEPKVKKRAAKATTSRAKRTKANVGETSTKHRHRPEIEIKVEVIDEPQNDLRTEEIKQPVCEPKIARNKLCNDSKIDKHNMAKPKITLVKKSFITITPGSGVLPELKKCGKAEKHRANIKEILMSSNATPIQRHGVFGYSCSYCKDQYRVPADLKTHTLEAHKNVTQACFIKNKNMYDYFVKLDITSLCCTLCNTSIDTLEHLMRHLKELHKKNIYTDIDNHIMPFKFESQLLCCCICKTVFSRFKLLLEHMNTHYRNYVCDVCDAGFVNSMKLWNHKETHKTGSFDCSYCGKTFNTVTKKGIHERVVHVFASKPHKCGYCSERFTALRFKDEHLATVHGVHAAEFKCQACDEKFSSQVKLRIHTKRDHLLERSHLCSHCNKNFFTRNELEKHMVKHTGERKYQCEVCSRSYGRKKTLIQHMLIHNNERRFKCEHCGQAFVQKYSWRGHMRSKHGKIV